MTSKAEYLGDLRVKNTHLQSGNIYLTDAPTDNHGKGEAFSPTDTVATALGNCMLTTMGIKAESADINMQGTIAEITKTMASNPRRISKIKVVIYFPQNYSDKLKKTLQNTALHCPVLESLHPEMGKEINFFYGQI